MARKGKNPFASNKAAAKGKDAPAEEKGKGGKKLPPWLTKKKK